MKKPLAILAAKRTPIGSFQGQFSACSTTHLGSEAISGAISQAKIDTNEIDEVIMGCVLPAGLGQAPARQAALGAGLPQSTACTTINKVCGSGMKSIMMACDGILSGQNDLVVAGGMESMTLAPYLLPQARKGYRMGHQTTYDHMFLDGLQNPYDQKMMGDFAELCADKFDFSREDQDQWAERSVKRSQDAIESGHFVSEITPVTVRNRKSTTTVLQDEEPGRMDISKISTLRPAFKKEGTVTAANASKISDGAAATLISSIEFAEQHSIPILANILAYCSYAQEPEWFTTAPVGAIKKLLDKLDWQVADVDLWEINEAFAVVTLAAMKSLAIDSEKVNINGGACALGHPIGASGTRIVVSLIHALKQHNLKRGIATLCIGGGEATAIAIEIP